MVTVTFLFCINPQKIKIEKCLFYKKKKSLKIKFYNIDCFYEEKTLVLDLMIDILLNN